MASFDSEVTQEELAMFETGKQALELLLSSNSSMEARTLVGAVIVAYIESQETTAEQLDAASDIHSLVATSATILMVKMKKEEVLDMLGAPANGKH